LPEKILIIEDESRMRRVLQLVLETQGYLVLTAADGEDGIIKWNEFQPDVVFTDLKMPKADGMAVLKHGNRKFSKTPVILLTAFGTIPTAVEAMRQGAFDYITKPVNNDIIIEKAKNALKKRALSMGQQKSGPVYLTGSSKIMESIRKELQLVAATNTSVFITGESGTGKELAAKTIYQQSPRKDKPFVRLNCAAIPGDLMESELFGHIKGAFTGAFQNRTGAFVKADCGTLFLDEVGDLPYGLQAKLLHAVEDKIITPVGAAKSIKVDVKIISATNQNIETMVQQKTFRSDLYFRLNTYTIHMPPLRDRTEDIPKLAYHFLSFFCKAFDRSALLLQKTALKKLSRHAWPGNVRELKNMVERLVLVAKSDIITEDMINQIFSKNESSNIEPVQPLTENLFVHEQNMIATALTACDWNISKAARHLGITRNTLRYRIKKFNITP